jgi:hypothetical protein
MTAAWQVDRQVADVGQAGADLGLAPHLDVVGLAVPEDVADLFAGHQGGRRPAHIARLDPVDLGLSQVDPDIDLGDVLVELHELLDGAVDAGDGLPHLLRLLLEDVQVGAADADRDGLAGPGQDLADTFLQVGLYVPPESGIAVDHLLDGSACLVVVDLGIDADPVLAEVDAVGLVGQQGLPDVGAEVAHPGDGAQLPAGRGGDPDLLRVGGARRGYPMHQEVPLLEVGEQ